MKILNLFFITLLFTLSGYAQKINQPVGFNNSAIEQNVLAEINTARTNPQIYIAYLEGYKKLIKGDIIYFPNGIRMPMIEGSKVIDEAIIYLKNLPPLEPIQFSEGLSKPAALQINSLIEDAALGHAGKDGSDLAKRLTKFGISGRMFSESIIYYVQNPRDIVLTMIIDDGVKSRGDRKNIFSSKFKQTGLAYGKDSKGNSYFVAIFTDAFQEANVSAGLKRIF